MKLTATGYIVTDIGGIAINGIGATEAEARADALQWVGPFEDRDGNTVSPDDEQFGLGASNKIFPATAALIEKVKAEGGAIRWGCVDGICCTDEEEKAEREADE